MLLELVISWVTEPGINYFKVAEQATGPSNLFAWFPIIFYVHLQVYLVAALTILKAYEQRILQQLSYQEGVNLSWLRILLRVCLVIAFVGMSISIFRLVSPIELWPRAIYSMSLMFSVYYLIAFKAMAQPSIFNQLNAGVSYPDVLEAKTASDLIETSTAGAGIEPIAQYQTSSLTPELAQQYWQDLQEYIVQHKPYLNNELRIKDIADSLGIPSNHLSQVINQCAGQNFFEFINDFRIEVAKTLLSKTDTRQLNINLIALEAGFNSQSAFYKQFKLRVNKTPKQYRDQFLS
ncbi:MAG: AraC family transcriptional regulator [Bermanella sp.]